MIYTYSIILTPRYSAQVNAVLGDANNDLPTPGTPGQPSTYNMDPLQCLNALGQSGWYFAFKVDAVEPYWPDENGPPVDGLVIMQATEE